MSTRAIAKALSEFNPPCVNPNTGNPWTHITIEKDLKTIQQKWLAATQESAEKHRADLVAELNEAEQIAFTQEDIPAVVSCVKQKAALLGVSDEPSAVVGALIVQFVAATPPEIVTNADDNARTTTETVGISPGE